MCRRLNLPILFGLALVLCLGWGALVQAEIPRPVGFWRFEGNTADSGSGGNNGILKGSAALVTDPERGKCLELDGDGYVDIASGLAELGDADFTISAWIKTSEVGVSILSKSNGDTEWNEAEKEMYVADSELSEGQSDGTVEIVGHSSNWIRGEVEVDDSKWHHIAITWDIEEEKGLVYVDGEDATGDVGFEGLADNAEDTVRIGFSESVHSSENFVGRIDDVAIFDVALSPGQVAELMSAGAKGMKPIAAKKDTAITLDTDPHLAGWWKFDDTSGKTAMDSSRHGRKGTLEGGLSFEENSAAGKTGKALNFDGRDHSIVIAKYKGVTGTRPRTVAAWIKTTTSRGQIMSWGSDDYGKMWIFGFIRGRVGVTPNGGYLYINEATHDNEWHHVAAVVQEAELPNLHDDVKLYKDGEPAAIHDIGLLDLWPIDTGSDMDVTIGRRFKGLLDDVRVYDRPLVEDEIKALSLLRSNRPLPKSRR